MDFTIFFKIHKSFLLGYTGLGKDISRAGKFADNINHGYGRKHYPHAAQQPDFFLIWNRPRPGKYRLWPKEQY